MSHPSIHTALTVRQLVIGSVQAIPEELFDTQPGGSNNTIRWNIGHQVTMLNWFLASNVPLAYKLPDAYNTLFMSGSKPADWTAAPPTKEELLEQLSAQYDSLMKVSPESLGKSLNPPFVMGPLEFRTAAELFNFAFIHEAVHLGVISSLVKQISYTP
ncbi:DinB superfamily protein [Paenibacillus sp. 1_12]|uniref:DinB family protein n=1 Tax=Paenibacillus sp. 1_12 TaxID=1566278 RepID=UPI0008E733D5|nr:DinB family protein [Paenibacillus sp. 1_12]SFK78336.1 DinB superfamily protein [Paenibacillus sp. 1_12]